MFDGGGGTTMTSKYETAKSQHQASADLRDARGGAYDPVNEFGKPQPDQPRVKRTSHQDAQWGADVRPEPVPAVGNSPLPEGLRRPRKGPLGKSTGRRGT
jgi:hypothetical protein